MGSTLAFEWQLYTLDEIIAAGKEFGLFVLSTCAEFNEEKPIAPDKLMMQIVSEKKSFFETNGRPTLASADRGCAPEVRGAILVKWFRAKSR